MSENWQVSLKTNAKTFYLASLFFPRAVFKKVKAYYALCRFIDDTADKNTSSLAELRLNQIWTDLNLLSPKMEINSLYKQSYLSEVYVADLIEGAKFDLKPVRIKDYPQFIDYCYKVAGSVGLVMCDVMNVTDKKARAFAVDLGIAMQITNICRDVLEDSKIDRVYLPESVLVKYQSSSNEIIKNTINPQILSRVMDEVLALADKYYSSAKQAYHFIPWRSRGSIIIAGNLYRQIGVKLKRNGSNPMLGRTVVGPFEKTYILVLSLFEWILSGMQEANKTVSHAKELHRGLEGIKQARGFGD